MPPRNETAAPAGAENSTLYVAIEISRKSWVVGIKSPVNERIGLHTIEAANVGALQDLIERHRATLAVLFLHARHPYPAQHGGVATVVRQQRTHHLLRVNQVCLVLLRLPVHQKARRIEHNRLKGHGTVEPTCQPKAFVARLVAVQNAHLTLENPFGHERTAGSRGRIRRVMIVALARKLLIALWRFSETGLVPTGATIV